MRTDSFLAHAHRESDPWHVTRNEYRLDTSPDWQERRDQRRVWTVILSAAVALAVLFVVVDASRTPLYAYAHAEEPTDASR